MPSIPRCYNTNTAGDTSKLDIFYKLARLADRDSSQHTSHLAVTHTFNSLHSTLPRMPSSQTQISSTKEDDENMKIPGPTSMLSMSAAASSSSSSSGGNYGIIVGLNGALQKRCIFPTGGQLIPGNVHRIARVEVGIGGKGQDVAIALHCLGYSESKMAQFLGLGPEGDQVYDMMQGKMGTASMDLTVRTQAPLRTCTSLVASDTTTELVEPSGVISKEEMAELFSKLETKQEDDSSSSKIAALCIMGSMPPGCSEDTYAKIYQTTIPNKNDKDSPTVCVVDSVAGLEPLLKAMAANPNKNDKAIFKINASELCTLAKVTKTNNEVDGIAQDELVEAITGFLTETAQKALTALAITDGKHPAHLAMLDDATKGFTLYQLPTARLDGDQTLFPIGAGDAVAGGTLAAWQSLLASSSPAHNCLPPDNLHQALEFHLADNMAVGEEEKDVAILLSAFAFGLACGSASCLEEENSVLQPKQVLDLFTKTGKPTFLSSHTF